MAGGFAEDRRSGYIHGRAAGRNRRTSPRRPSRACTLIRPDGPPGTLAHPGRLRDLSEGGVGLFIVERFPPGTLLKLAPVGTVSSATLCVEVVHSKQDDGGWLHGCQFLTADDAQVIRRWFPDFWS